MTINLFYPRITNVSLPHCNNRESIGNFTTILSSHTIMFTLNCLAYPNIPPQIIKEFKIKYREKFILFDFTKGKGVA